MEWDERPGFLCSLPAGNIPCQGERYVEISVSAAGGKA